MTTRRAAKQPGTDATHSSSQYEELLEENESLRKALRLAERYVAKMVADNVDTVVPPAHALKVIQMALGEVTKDERASFPLKQVE